MNFHQRIARNRVKEIIQHTIDLNNPQESFIPDSEIEIDMHFVMSCDFDYRIKFYMEQIDRTHSLILKKNYLYLIIEEMTNQIRKKHCT